MTGEYCDGSVCDLEKMKMDGVHQVSNEELLELPCDVLIPALLDNVIAKKNARKDHARFILELANGPATPEADAILEKKDITVIPRCARECRRCDRQLLQWSQGRSGEQWTEEQVDNELKRVILNAYKAVRREARRENLSYRQASFSVGIKGILEAMRVRMDRVRVTLCAYDNIPLPFLDARCSDHRSRCRRLYGGHLRRAV